MAVAPNVEYSKKSPVFSVFLLKKHIPAVDAMQWLLQKHKQHHKTGKNVLFLKLVSMHQTELWLLTHLLSKGFFSVFLTFIALSSVTPY